MKSKKIITLICKIIISSISAFIILSFLCHFYYNLPVRCDSASGATDYEWEKKKFYSRATEGIAWGKTNNEGYVNTFDYEEGMPIDILVMGSSHMEGFNVSMEENMGARLNALLPNDTVYNIGLSEHNFLVCVDNLENALNKYKPSKYVIIETSNVFYDEEQLKKVLQEETDELKVQDTGIVSLLQKSNYLRLVYKQLNSFLDSSLKNDMTDRSKNKKNATIEFYDALMNKIHNIAEKFEIEIILMYHPQLSLGDNGNVITNDDGNAIKLFEEACDNNEIIFLNMTNAFVEKYNQEHILPHGFCNTSIGQGHLNKYGHLYIAEEVYKVIEETE